MADNAETAREKAIAKANAGLVSGTGKLDLTKPENAASARLQAQADAYFKANPNIDPLTGQVKTVTGPTQPPAPGPSTGPTQPPVVRNSAYDLLLAEFTKYGLGTLVSDIKNLITNDTSSGELTLLLRNTEAYKKRFAANAARLEKGLTALDEKSYLNLEDAYQNIMRNYGLPDTYWKKDALGTQEGFTKLIANDVSATELEDRILTAQNRVLNANPEVLSAIKNFYGDSVTNGDILAYALDPQKALTDIKRKVTAAEIQGAANTFGFNKITANSTPEQIKAMEARANSLAGYGINKEQALAGYQTVSEIAPRGSELAAIYNESPYGQAEAESEVFKTSGAAEAAKKRKKLTQLEQASFSGSSGLSSGALSRDRALNSQSYGAGAY